MAWNIRDGASAPDVAAKISCISHCLGVSFLSSEGRQSLWKMINSVSPATTFPANSRLQNAIGFRPSSSAFSPIIINLATTAEAAPKIRIASQR